MIETDLHYAPEEVTPPGATLGDLMEERGLSQAELSRRLKRPPQAINEIIAGKKEITEDTALELERVLQVPAHFWLARDARYREYLARLRDGELREAQVPWVETFPLKALQAAGVLPAGRLTPAFKQQLVDHLCEWGDEVSSNAIEVYVHRLRKKIERCCVTDQPGVQIVTVRGLGYCLERVATLSSAL